MISSTKFFYICEKEFSYDKKSEITLIIHENVEALHMTSVT